MALCLMLSALPVLAQETPTEVNWKDYEERAAQVEGGFYTVSDTGLVMFIPSEFIDSELSEEALESGTFMLLKTEDETAVVNAQVVELDLDTFLAALAQSGVGDPWELLINGLPFTNFTVEADGVISTCAAIGTEQGSTLVFSFAPADDAKYMELFRIMAASLQLAE